MHGRVCVFVDVYCISVCAYRGCKKDEIVCLFTCFYVNVSNCLYELAIASESNVVMLL